MKAVVQSAVGQSAELLKLIDVDDPRPGPAEIVIDVTLAPVHHGDLLQIRAQPSIAEEVGHLRRGTEAVGIVSALGTDVAGAGRLKVGDQVIGFPAAGSWAQSVLVPAWAAIPLPPQLDDHVAAQLLVNYVAARMVLHGLRKSVAHGVFREAAVLVTGAGTVVARLLLHFLDQEGIKPIGLARSAATAERVATELAGVEVAAIEDEDWRERITSIAAGRKIVGILDCVAGSLIADLLPLMADEAAIVVYGALGGGQPMFGPADLIGRQLVVRGALFARWFGEFSAEEKADDIEAAFRLAAELPSLFKLSSIHGLADIGKAVIAVEARGRDGFVFVKP